MSILERRSCPNCGSSDNLVVWDDGHSYCFSPNCSYNKSTSMKLTNKSSTSDTIKNFTPVKGKSISIHKRKITAHTCSKYGVIAYRNEIHFPYYEHGKLKGYKVRNPFRPKKKSFYVKGKVTNLLFGSQCIHNKKVIAITSGEYDAMSICQMTNVTGLSLANDSVAEMTIRHNLEWLETFEKVFLCIDNDTSGQKATDTICSIIRPYQTYRMTFPGGFKDANEMLMAGESKLFTKAFWSARPTPIKTVFTKSELSEQLKTHHQSPPGISTGINKLDNLLGGLRNGEMTVVMGKASVGKSTFARIVISNLLRNQYKCMVFALEEEPIRYDRRLLHSYTGRPIISIKQDQRNFLIDEMSEYLISSKLNGITPIEQIIHDIEYAVRQRDVKFVLVDNIAAGVNKKEIYAQTSDYISHLFSAAKKFNVHIICVCHIGRQDKRNPKEPGIDSGYGSGAIEQQPDNILLVDKSDNSNKSTVKLLKNRELGLPVNPGSRYISLTYNIQSGRYDEETKQRRTSNSQQLSSSTNKSSLQKSGT